MNNWKLQWTRLTSRRRIGVLTMMLAALMVLVTLSLTEDHASAEVATVAVDRGSIILKASTFGTLVPGRKLDLTAPVSGRLLELLVAEGDAVETGQVLARFDQRDQMAQVQEAQLRLDAAMAQQHSAQLRLDELHAGTKPETVAAARARLVQAQANLQQVADEAAVREQRSKDDLEIAANALRKAQDAYSSIWWQTHKDDGSFKRRPGDRGYQEDYDRFVGAERELRDAEARIRQAQVAFDEAQKRKPPVIASADAQVRDAASQLDAALRGPSAADLARAEADLIQARTSYTQAQLTLAQAQDRLEQLTIVAPFTAKVVGVHAAAGTSLGIGVSLLTLSDEQTLFVETRLSEHLAVIASRGQRVEVLLDALDRTLAGAIVSIAPQAEHSNGVPTYKARIRLEGRTPGVRIGLTATVTLVTEQRFSTLRLPITAVITNERGTFVELVEDTNSEPRLHPVQVGLNDGSLIEIMSGLDLGDQVVQLPELGALVPSTTLLEEE